MLFQKNSVVSNNLYIMQISQLSNFSTLDNNSNINLIPVHQNLRIIYM